MGRCGPQAATVQQATLGFVTRRLDRDQQIGGNVKMGRAEICKSVREHYSRIAREQGACCEPADACRRCNDRQVVSRAIGYTEEELQTIPEGADLGLGCGNPTALASLRKGEVVLDLGSGGGIDCFLAARAVGGGGKVIGIDMTPEMLEKARANAEAGGYQNVEFRLGEIENLPVADNSVDVVISNCVINLSPDKGRVFREAYRVLKPGGRMMVSDIVTTGELPRDVRENPDAWSSCIGGAMQKTEYLVLIEGTGFKDVKLLTQRACGDTGDPRLTGLLESVSIRADKWTD